MILQRCPLAPREESRLLGCLVSNSGLPTAMILARNSAYISRSEMATLGKPFRLQTRNPTATPLPLREWLSGLCPSAMSLGNLAGLVQRPDNHRGRPVGVAFHGRLRGGVTR